MNKKDYLKRILRERHIKVLKEHQKAVENKVKIYDELNDKTNILTDKRYNFLQDFKKKNNTRIKDLENEYNLINDILDELMEDI